MSTRGRRTQPSSTAGGTTPEWQAVLDTLTALVPRPDYLVASGSLPPGLPADFYARVAQIALRSGIKLVLDTSGEPLRRAAGAGVYLLKPSLREFEELTGERNCEEARLPMLGQRLIDEGRCCDVAVASLE